MVRGYFRDKDRSPKGIYISQGGPNGWQLGASFLHPTDKFDKKEGDKLAYANYQTAKPIPFNLDRTAFMGILGERAVPWDYRQQLYVRYTRDHYYGYVRQANLPKYWNEIAG